VNDRLLGAVEPEVADVLRRLPAAWLDELGPDEAHMVSPAVAAVLGRAAEELDGWPTSTPTVWQVLTDHCVPGTPFAGIRMEAPYGPVCAVASPGTSSAWFSWLPIGFLCARGATAPLLLVVHDVDRRARELRDMLGHWAEDAGCFVLAPEFLVDPRDPDGDLAYATGAHAAQAALELVAELSDSVGVSFPQVVVMAIGSGGALVPALLRTAPGRVAGCVLLSPDATSVLDVLGSEAPPEAARTVPLVVLAGGADTARPAQGSSAQTGLGDARRVVTALERVGLDVRLELVPGSGGEVLHSRAEAVEGPDRPTAMVHAAAATAAALLGLPG
jgi:pimeloyl-ACP methyl ester carboxylesterase